MRTASAPLVFFLALLVASNAFNSSPAKRPRLLAISTPSTLHAVGRDLWIPPSAPVDSEAALRLTLKKSLEGATFKKNLSILGSTGSIGTQTLDIVRAKPENFAAVALSAGRNINLLVEQIKEFRPVCASTQTPEDAALVRSMLSDAGVKCEIYHGIEGVDEVAKCEEADTVVTGIVGAVGLQPTMSAIRLGKDIALANKETLISGGPVINPLVKEFGVNMLPADSEHSAIFQSLQGCPPEGLRRVILTASGGAFRDFTKDELFNMCRDDPEAVQKKATTHPNWDMGAKITLDSATMCNKGLEVIEAHYLFGASYDDIDIVVHPQSIVHSMVEMQDTSVISQMGWADMRLPLVYAVSWPQRLRMDYKPLDLAEIGSLTFKAPDHSKYPCINLCYAAGRAGGTMTAILNAANEAANEKFRDNVGLGFLDIPKLIEAAMEGAREEGLYKTDDVTLEDILAGDEWARKFVEGRTEKLVKGQEKKILV
ncbi:hypothetical protein TrST_g553 [Triparma strigata]|uniref:1-deoxy-D-xylulose 5-phosphate reductoisomerase, apicoplastic n=1 Tax=Triparma strigata TaxID=1606541 RepID=A0A9W7EVC9_9STRA|nr:hypothetical protein TrST_g553 [Triparma strigata]